MKTIKEFHGMTVKDLSAVGFSSKTSPELEILRASYPLYFPVTYDDTSELTFPDA
jgi:hypothetical protein